MVRPTLLVLVLSACVDQAAAPGSGAVEPVAAEPADDGAADADADDHPRGLKLDLAPDQRGALDRPTLAVGTTAAAAPRIIYLNRAGGTYTPGSNDARVNRSSIVGTTSTVPAWDVSDAGWAQVRDCVADHFAPWNVEVTDVDPGAVAHLESVIAGSPDDLDNDALAGAGGVSPWDPQGCGEIGNSIVFTFAAYVGSNQLGLICDIAAQEIAHSYGLDHEFLCQDPMTYLSGCGGKSFQDVDAACGELEARPCACSATQNSVALLTARLGRAGGGDDDAPSVAITFPAEGQVVAPGFVVTATASEDVAVSEVELRVDGVAVAVDATAPYELAAPDGLPDGAHTVAVVAQGRGAAGHSSIDVMVDRENGVTDPGGGGDGGAGGATGGCASAGGAGPVGALALLGLLTRGRARTWRALPRAVSRRPASGSRAGSPRSTTKAA